MINIYQDSGNEAILIGRDENGKRTFKRKSLVPYFYVLDFEGKYKDIFGNNVKKIEVENSWDITKLRENYSQTYESDVLFVDKVMIDTIDKIEKEPLRICYFDIENLGSIDCENTPEPISCICCYDNFKKKKYEFIWHPTYKGSSNVEENMKVCIFNNEKQMLKKFIEFVCDLDFDILTGWFVEGFDIPYIVNRCRKLKIKEIDNISMKDKIYLKKSKEIANYDISIKGRYVLDLLKGYKQLTFHVLDSYSLNEVAKDVIKDYKIEHEDESFKEMWENHPEKLLEYCMQDTMLCVRIDEKKGIINYFDELRRLIGTRWENIWNATRLHDIIFLRKAKELGVVLPRKVKKDKIAYGGGFVAKPKPGLHKNIFVIDLVSLYPNIIRSFNLSPETINIKGNISVNGLRIDESKRGICPMIVDDILTKRFKVKKEMKLEKEKNGESDLYKMLYAKQYGLKIAINSLYGALGTPYFRMFKNEIAETITFLGRKIIKWSCEKVEEFGYEVVYNDTDSCFVYIPDSDDMTSDEIKTHAAELDSFINESYNELVKSYGVTKKHNLEMDFEKLFTEIFFGAATGGGSVKKRYAGNIIEKGKKKMMIKGFEAVRSDASKIERVAQKEVFRLILDNKQKNEVDNYINNLKANIKNGKYSPKDFAIRRGINKLNHKDIYTDSILYSNKYLGTKFTTGCKLKMLFVKGMPAGYPPTNAISFEKESQIPEGVIIDWNKIFNRIFDKKFERIYTAMGWNSNIIDARQMIL